MGMALALYLTWIRRTGLEPREIINMIIYLFQWFLGNFRTATTIFLDALWGQFLVSVAILERVTEAAMRLQLLKRDLLD